MTVHDDAVTSPPEDDNQNPRSGVEPEIAQRLVEQAKAEGVDLVGPGGLLSDLTKQVLETGLECGGLASKVEEHLGYPKHDPSGREAGSNSRNGVRTKTVTTEVGPVEVEVPRDRDGTFDPKTVRKRQRRLVGVDAMVISLVAKGLTTGEVQAYLAETYGTDISRETISKITDRILDELSDWLCRPLDRRRFLPVVANYDVLSIAIKSARTLSGVRSPRMRRGRWLSSRATLLRSSRLCVARLVRLGKYWRRRPLVFSLVARCQGA